MNNPATISAISASAVQRARQLVDQLSVLGARYDAAPLFPTESVKSIVAAGLHRSFAPMESGGEAFEDARLAHRALFDVLRLIGRADLSVGRLFEGHVNALKLFQWYGSSTQLRRLGRDLGHGKFFGVWATEPRPGVMLHTDQTGFRLEGAKSFATGAGGLDYAIVTAQPDRGDRRLVIVAANDAARADLSGWRVRGMRASGSGRYDLTGIRPETADLLGDPGIYDFEPRFTGGAWRFAAVQLGGIEALLIETRAAMSDQARGDPLARAKFADAVAAARTAYLWVRECAQRAADEDEGLAALARLTRGVVERAAFDVMELAARIIGTRSAFDGQRIDKIIRDLSLYLRQGGPDYARDQAALAWLESDPWGEDDLLW